MAHLFIMQAAAAVKEDSPAATKEASKFAIGCLNTSRLNNMMREAQPHAIRRVEELDRDPLLLNFANGTCDARTGELREHRLAYLVTKIIPFNYNPAALCPKWEVFLSDHVRQVSGVGGVFPARRGLLAYRVDAGEMSIP